MMMLANKLYNIYPEEEKMLLLNYSNKQKTVSLVVTVHVYLVLVYNYWHPITVEILYYHDVLADMYCT